MHQVDNLAKEALNILINDSPPRWSIKQRSAWSRFVNGLIFRVPERVPATRKYLEEFWRTDYEKHKAHMTHNGPKAILISLTTSQAASSVNRSCMR